jgi:MoxR-like ATPase
MYCSEVVPRYDAGVRGGALFVVGDSGVGKTAVLDEFAAAEAVKGVRVLRAAGVQFEAEVGYCVLNQLLFPLGAEMPAHISATIALR